MVQPITIEQQQLIADDIERRRADTPEARQEFATTLIRNRATLMVDTIRALQSAKSTIEAGAETAKGVAKVAQLEGAAKREAVEVVTTSAENAVETVSDFMAEIPYNVLAGASVDFVQSLTVLGADVVNIAMELTGGDEAFLQFVAAPGIAGLEAAVGGPNVEASLVAERLRAERPPDAQFIEFSNLDEPLIPSPSTSAGQFMRHITSFVLAMIPVAKGVKALGIASGAARAGRVVGGAGRIAEGALNFGLTTGVLAEPGEQRLSNLIEAFPALRNPITGFLAADPEGEGRWEARLKTGLENLGVGVLFEALMPPLRLLKGAARPSTEQTAERVAKQLAIKATAAGQVTAATKAAQRALKALPKEAAEAAEIILPRELLPPRAGSQVGQAYQTVSNLITRVDAEAGTALTKAVESARATATDFAILKEAGSITTKQLMRVTPGSTRTSISPAMDRAFQVRREVLEAFLTERSGKLTLLRKAGEAADEALELEFTFFARFYEALATRHQTGISSFARGLRQQQQRVLTMDAAKRIAKDTQTITGEIDSLSTKELLQAFGGRDALDEFTWRASQLRGPEAVSDYWRNTLGKWGRKSEEARFFWYSGLLSGLAIPKALGGNTTYVAQLVAERAISARLPSASLSLVPGRRAVTSTLSTAALPDVVVAGEATAMVQAAIHNIVGAIRAGAKVLTEPAFETVAARSRFGGFRINPFFQRAVELEARGVVSTRIPLYRAMGKVLEYPTRGLVAIDEATQALVISMELEARALREATIRGMEPKAAERFIESFMRSPPRDVAQAALQMGREAGLRQETGPFAAKLIAAAQENIVGAFLAPFLRVGINRTRLLLARSPLGLLAPSIRADLAAGGARSQAALGKMASGSLMIMAGFDLAQRGRASGRFFSTSGANRALGGKVPTNSILSNEGNWLPLGDTLQSFAVTVGADMYYHSKAFFDRSRGTLTERGLALFGAAAVIAADEIALEDVTVAFEALFSGQSEGITALGKAQRLTEDVAASIAVPQAVRLAQRVEISGEPPFISVSERNINQLNTVWDRIIDRAGLEAEFPERDYWGTPRKDPNPFFQLIPLLLSQPNRLDDVDHELLALQVATGRFPVQPPGDTIEGIDLTPAEIDFYHKTAGETLRKKERTRLEISSPIYQGAPPDEKVRMVQNINTELNATARELTKAKFSGTDSKDPLIQRILAERLRKLGTPSTPQALPAGAPPPAF